MPSYDVNITIGKEDYEFLRFKGVKMNMSISSVIKNLIREDRQKQKAIITGKKT